MINCQSIIEYQFSHNFGEVFFDYSLHQNAGVNGASANTTEKNTIATDRGAYFPVGDSRVQLPPNEEVPLFLMPSNYSMLFWGNFEDYSYYILYQYSSSIILSLKRYVVSSQISFRIKTSDFDSNEIFSGLNVLLPENWNLILIKLSTTVTISINNVNILSFTLPVAMNYDGNLVSYIGYPSISTGLVGILWNFLISDLSLSIFNYFSPVTTSNCIVPGCSPCNPALISNYITGCLSTSTDYFHNSLGNTCLGCVNGCSSNGVCLDCVNCQEKTCQILNNTPSCMCDPKAIPSVFTCDCGNFYIYSQSSCHQCEIGCLNCHQNLTCSSCIANNSHLVDDFCVCDSLFYNLSSLNAFNSCLPCNPKCKSCDSIGKCTSCYDLNANKSNYCACNEGFFESRVCVTCYSECKTCSIFGKCDSCVALNAFPTSFGCKCMSGYGSAGQLTDINSCVLCGGQCSACTSVLSCTICKDLNASPYGSGCRCNPGFYLADSGLCENCPRDCENCDKFQCTQCWSKYAVPNNTHCQCPLGTYQVKSFLNFTECQLCNSDCISCNTSNLCNECKISGAVPAEIGCACPAGYYDNAIECTLCQNWDFINQTCIFCNANEFFQDGICKKCPSLCRTCDQNTCLSCVDHAEISNKSCKCSNHYSGTIACNLVPFTLKLSISGNNNILLTFSQDLSTPISAENISLTIESLQFTFNVTQWAANQFLILISYSESFFSNKTATLIFKSPIYSNSNSQLSISTYSILLESFSSTVSHSTVASYESTASTAIITFASLTILLSVLNFNFISLWSFLNIVQLLIYIRLTKQYIPPKLNAILKAFRKLNMLPNVFSYFITAESSDVPDQHFVDFGFSTTNLLLNIGNLFTALLIIIVNMIFVEILNKSKKFRGLNFQIVIKFIEAMRKSFRYGAFIRFFIQSYLDMGICSLIAILSVCLGTWGQMLNYILSFLFYIYGNKPFSEPVINYVNIYSELIISIVYIIIPVISLNLNSKTQDILDDTLVYLVFTILGSQVFTSIFLMFHKLKLKFNDYRNRNKVFVMSPSSAGIAVITQLSQENFAWKETR